MAVQHGIHATFLVASSLLACVACAQIESPTRPGMGQEGSVSGSGIGRTPIGRTQHKDCATPPIVQRKDLTAEEKQRLLMEVAADPASVKGALFLPLYLERQDLPAYVEMTQDTRRNLPVAGDDAFARHCGYHSGLALWQGGFDRTILRLVDIRWVFPTPKEASAYLREQGDAAAEGQPRIVDAPSVGMDCTVFGGTTDVRGTPLTHLYYIFRVQNVVVKLYVAQGPDVSQPDQRLTPEKVAKWAQRAAQRIADYNRSATENPEPPPRKQGSRNVDQPAR